MFVRFAKSGTSSRLDVIVYLHVWLGVFLPCDPVIRHEVHIATALQCLEKDVNAVVNVDFGETHHGMVPQL